MIAAQAVKKNCPAERVGRKERKPPGCPSTFDHPPQRQNCKIMLQNSILQFRERLDEKVRKDLFDKLSCFVIAKADGAPARAAE